MIVFAADLSLTSTGYAVAVEGRIERSGVIPGRGSGMPRMIQMRNDVMAQVDAVKPALIVMEDLAFSMNKSYAKEIAQVTGMIRAEMFTDQIPYVVIVPSSLKKWATGKGNAPKEQVIKEVFKRWGHDCATSDEADALAAAYLGMALTGEWEPTIEPQREVLATVRKSNDLSFLPAPAVQHSTSPA